MSDPTSMPGLQLEPDTADRTVDVGDVRRGIASMAASLRPAGRP